MRLGPCDNESLILVATGKIMQGMGGREAVEQDKHIKYVAFIYGNPFRLVLEHNPNLELSRHKLDQQSLATTRPPKRPTLQVR